MAKKKVSVIAHKTGVYWGFGFIGVVLAGVMIGLTVAGVQESFNVGFLALAGVGALLALMGAYGIFCPSRLLLTAKHLLWKTHWGRYIGQVPYDNIADVRVHHIGDPENPVETVGIDLVKNNAKDTWWPGPPFKSLKTYDVHIGDRWEKPATVLVRMIKSKMEDFFSEAARGGK